MINIIRKLTVPLIAFLALVAPALAQSEMPMAYEITPREDANVIFANLIEESLERDPGGDGLIRGTPCTTPNYLLKAIRTYHPDIVLEGKEGLAAFIRSLQLRPAKENGYTGRYRMSRMICEKPGTSTGKDLLDLEGWERSFRANEGAWFHPNHDQPILAADCGNVVKAPAPQLPQLAKAPDCFEFSYDYRNNGRVEKPTAVTHGFWAENLDMEKLFYDKCFFVEDGATGERYKPFRKCPEEICPPHAVYSAWPGDVSLGDTPDYIAAFRFTEGYGTLSVPKWFVHSGLPCVKVIHGYTTAYYDPRHHVVMRGTALTLYDSYTSREVELDIDTGKETFHRTLVARCEVNETGRCRD